MAISLYTGTPGSGKSLHAARNIIARLKSGGGLICNFPVNENVVKRPKAHVEYWDNSELSAARLVKYAMEHHQMGKEGQTLVVIDECQLIFGSRDIQRKDRSAWITLFSQHRKLGYDFILITQLDRMIDRQIRGMIETETRHRKLNNYGLGGWIMCFLLGNTSWFMAIEYWSGGNKLKLDSTMFCYRKIYGQAYDSYRLFSDMATSGGAVCAGGNRASGGVPSKASTARREQERKKLVLRLIAVLDVMQNSAAAPQIFSE